LRSYCRKEFVPIGYVRVKIKDLNTWKYLNMYVVKYDRQPLQGRKWMNQLQTSNKFVTVFRVFGRAGQIAGSVRRSSDSEE